MKTIAKRQAEIDALTLENNRLLIDRTPAAT